MKKISFCLLLFLTLSFYSCNSERQKEIDFIDNVLSEHADLSNYNWLVIIPGVGCNGCIQEGEYFLKKHVSDKTIGFVLTNISSLKILQQKTGIKLKEHENIYADTDNAFIVETHNSVYPCVVEIKDHHIVSLEFQSPQTPALRNLEETLMK